MPPNQSAALLWSREGSKGLQPGTRLSPGRGTQRVPGASLPENSSPVPAAAALGSAAPRGASLPLLPEPNEPPGDRGEALCHQCHQHSPPHAALTHWAQPPWWQRTAVLSTETAQHPLSLAAAPFLRSSTPVNYINEWQLAPQAALHTWAGRELTQAAPGPAPGWHRPSSGCERGAWGEPPSEPPDCFSGGSATSFTKFGGEVPASNTWDPRRAIKAWCLWHTASPGDVHPKTPQSSKTAQ